MDAIGNAFLAALHLIVSFDPDMVEIVGRSLTINLSAVAIAAGIGLPAGAALAMFQFPGRKGLSAVVSGFMGLPPVVVGLVVYLLLSRAGPFGVLGLLFTPTAMIIAQVLLVTPIITALTRQAILDLWQVYREPLEALGATPLRALPTMLWEGRFALATVILAGLGRASAEVGAVMIVGGNIDHLTRVMTTTIALETSKGDLPLALGLGLILVAISILINMAMFWAVERAKAPAT